eukprot:2089488-Rhodomonas_salina.1
MRTYVKINTYAALTPGVASLRTTQDETFPQSDSVEEPYAIGMIFTQIEKCIMQDAMCPVLYLDGVECPDPVKFLHVTL